LLRIFSSSRITGIMKFQCCLPILSMLLVVSAAGAEFFRLQITPIAPAHFEKRGDVLFTDFGNDVYGNLQLQFSSASAAGTIMVRLGEKLAGDGTIDRQPPGSVNYREIPLVIRRGQTNYQLQISPKKSHLGAQSVKMPDDIGEVTPFRYAEIEGAALPLGASGLRQLFVHAPFDDGASSFECSDATLSAVWSLCKHTMKATTAFGVYIDGERERTPYEADAYINMLSHYACDLDPRMARETFEYLLKYPTWPTEWSLHMPMMAAADYAATGDLKLAAANFDALKKKLLQDKARADGLLIATAIVDWPQSERDSYNDGRLATDDKRQVGPEINTVANAFYYHALREMAMLAHALKKEEDARIFETEAAQVYESFNRTFFDERHGIYIDGEGSGHASLHANMFPLAFGLVPTNHVKTVADFIESRGMACSVYGAQYLLEALFNAGRSDAGIQFMTARTKRSWWHMIEQGSTLTTEAWDVEFKKNLTWNHAWGAAPANILSRFVLGVRPIQPGYSEMLIAPQLGVLKWARGQVPTPRGPVSVTATNGDVFNLEVNIPRNTTARIEVPRRAAGQVVLDGKIIEGTAEGRMLVVSFNEQGMHIIQSR
jgi:alpha-L-rhamnosidase